jgi:hypothetical protein
MLLILACMDKTCCQCGPRDKKSCPPLLYKINWIADEGQSLRGSEHAPDVRPAEVGHGAEGQDVIQRQEVQGSQSSGKNPTNITMSGCYLLGQNCLFVYVNVL